MKVNRRKFTYFQKEYPNFKLHKVNDNKYFHIQNPLGVLKHLVVTIGCLVSIPFLLIGTMLCGLWEGITDVLPKFCEFYLLKNLKKVSPVFVFEIEDKEDI